MRQVANSGTSIDFQRNTRRYIQEGIILQEDTSSCKDLLWIEIISRERLFGLYDSIHVSVAHVQSLKPKCCDGSNSQRTGNILS
jgi:hypothetical protein